MLPVNIGIGDSRNLGSQYAFQPSVHHEPGAAGAVKAALNEINGQPRTGATGFAGCGSSLHLDGAEVAESARRSCRCGSGAFFRDSHLRASRREQMVENSMRDDELWRAERRLWLDSVAFFEECVGPDAMFVLPGGIVGRREALATARSAPPWRRVSLSAQRLTHPREDIAVLAYEACANGAERRWAYNACCSSTYVRARNSWLLTAHQQADMQPRSLFLTELGALELFFAAPCVRSFDKASSAR